MALTYRLKEQVINSVFTAIRTAINTLDTPDFFLVRHHLRVAYIAACDALAANTEAVNPNKSSEVYQSYARRLDSIALELQAINSELPGYHQAISERLNKMTRTLRLTSDELKTMKPIMPDADISQLKRALGVLDRLNADEEVTELKTKINLLLSKAA